jgi:hypothetical protein
VYPVDTENTETETTVTTEEPEPKEDILIKAIPVYPAYIVDQCGTVWGIPATLQGPLHKERISIQDTDGNELSNVDLYTTGGYIYVVHKYSTSDGTGATIENTDYYKQAIDATTIELVTEVPDKPAEERATLDSTAWLIETSVISGVTLSYLYNRNADVIKAYEYTGDKGVMMCKRTMITGFVVLDNGILIMAENGAEFCRCNRASMNSVSEPGRLWK